MEEAQKAGWNQEQLVNWASQYGVNQDELNTALTTGGAVELEFGKVAANLKTDSTLTLFQRDFSIDPNTHPLSKSESASQAESEHMVRLSELYQTEQDNLITPDDIDQWKKEILSTKGIRGKVTEQHLDLMSATANTYSKLSGIPAIDLLNKMLSAGGIQAMKFKEFAKQRELARWDKIGMNAEEVAALRQGKTVRGANGPSLIDFVRTLGGVRDTAGELAAMDAKLATRKAFTKSFVSDKGMDMDKAREAAVESGYLPEGATVADFLDAVAGELRGNPVYSVQNRNEQAIDQQLREQEMQYILDRAGVAATDSSEEALDKLEQFMSELAVEDLPFQKNSNIPDVKSLFQSSDNPLGALSSADGQNIVTLFEKADKSTFLHESGHIFLNFMRDMAETHGIQADVWTATKEWLGVGEDGVITKDMHEKWAEHFEVYLMEGTAPTPTLKESFRSFKRWLTKIYETFTSSRAGQRSNITVSPEIRDIFDRILATEQEIRATREQAALVAMLDEKLLNNSGFTQEQIDEYRRIAGQSEDSAREKRDTFKLSGYKARLAAFRLQAKNEATSVPVYGLIDRLTNKENPAAINKESIKTLFGEEVYKKLPDIARLWSKDGMDINQAVAEHGRQFGYETAADFVHDLAGMQKREMWLQKRVAQLEAEHDLSQDTDEAIRTASLRRMLEIESQWLSKQVEQQAKSAENKEINRRINTVNHLPRDVIKSWAERVINNRGIKQLNGIGKLIAESRKHRQQAIALAKKGDWNGALKSNEQARLTEELIAQSYKVKAEWEKIQRGWSRISKWTNDNKSVKIGQDFRDQINRLLSQYEISDKEFDSKAKDLHSFVADLAAADEDGMGTALASWVGVDISPAKSLTWDEIKDLNDALRFLYGHGRAEVEGLKTSRGEFIADIAGKILDSQADLKGDKLTTLRSESGKLNKTLRAIQKKYRKFFAHTAILRYIAQRMDGYSNVGGNGTMGAAEQLVQRIINGMAASNQRWEELNKIMEPHLRVLFNNRNKIYGNLKLPEKFRRYGFVWTRERVVTACLNMGNESNMQRLMDGYGIDEEGISALKKSLTAAEWKAIQNVWNTIDTLWPEIAAVHKRINFFEPKKLDRNGFTLDTADGQQVVMDGGYWPVAYDKTIDSDIAKWGEKDDILASSEAMLQTPVAKSGFTKGRNAKVTRPLLLSLSVLSTHLSDTIKYITLAETVRDADRVFRNKALESRNEETIGKDMHEMIRPTLKHVLRPEPNIYGPFETGRVKMSAYYMAYNAWTAIQNVTGVFPAIRATGMTNYVNGIYHVMKGPLQSHRAMLEASPYMRLREANIERDLKKHVREFKVDGFVINGKRYTVKDVQSLGWAGIRFIDTVVSLPAWWGKYNAEMEKHGDIQTAIEAADTAVNKAIGSGLAIDTTGIGRHKFLSLLAPFMSFASTQQEVLSSEHDAWKEGKMTTSDYLYGRLMIWVLPAMMSTFLQGALMYGVAAALGGGDDDKKKKDFKDYLTDLISYRLVGIPFVRDVFNAVNQGFEKKAPITSSRMPITEAFKMVQQLAYRAGNFAEEANEKRTKAVAWACAELASLAAGIPATRIYDRWVKGTKQIESGSGWWANHFIPQEKKK